MAQNPSSSAVRALQLELKKIGDEPVEGFRVEASEDNIFQWNVAIFGPPRTVYEGGYFKQIDSEANIADKLFAGYKRLKFTQCDKGFKLCNAKMTFPHDYPYSPPTIRFTTKILHPNVYQNGEVCISILHPPVDDPQSGELPSERWNPTQTVRTILLSVISLLNEPNTFSPANVDASVMYRKWKDSKLKEKEYENIIKQQVAASRLQAEEDNVKVPTTVSEYCITAKPKHTQSTHDQGSDFLVDDFADCDYDDMDDDDDDDEEDEDNYIDDADDSGNEES